MEPNASGRQMSRSSCPVDRLVCSAWNVLRLKNSVPASWITVAHQSMRRGSNASTRSRRRSTLTDSRYCSAAADVKNSEPAKNTAASAPAPTRCTKPGNGPTTKHAEPTANSTPIHQDARRGAHQAEPPGRESSEAALRCARA